MQNGSLSERDFFFEHQTSCSIISDDLKLVRLSINEPWKLYNLTTDPFEKNDVAAALPGIADRLLQKRTTWAEENNIFPLDPRPWCVRVKYYTTTCPDQEGVD